MIINLWGRENSKLLKETPNLILMSNCYIVKLWLQIIRRGKSKGSRSYKQELDQGTEVYSLFFCSNELEIVLEDIIVCLKFPTKYRFRKACTHMLVYFTSWTLCEHYWQIDGDKLLYWNVNSIHVTVKLQFFSFATIIPPCVTGSFC